MRTLSEIEHNRFLVCTKNAIDRLLFSPKKYLVQYAHLSNKEFAQQVRIEIVNLTNVGNKFNLDFWHYAKNSEHSSGYNELRELFEAGRMMNSCEFIVDGEWSEAA